MDFHRHHGFCPRFHALARKGLALLGFLSLAPGLLAQEAGYLLFDPVLIETETVTEDAPPNVVELTPLPTSTLAWDLQDYLRSRERDDTQAAQADATRHLEAINKLEASGGAYEPDLIEELIALGDLHQRQGEHQAAIESFQRALHVNRVNHGLYNLGQTPIIERLIESHLAAGNLTQADERQQYLFHVRQKAHDPDSPELLQAMSTLADWNIFAFNAYWGWPFAIRPLIGGASYFADPRPADGPNRAPANRLLDAQYLYHNVIRILLHSAGISDPRLLEAERKLALTHYFFATSPVLEPGSSSREGLRSSQSMDFAARGAMANSLGFRDGREALERRLTYLRETPGTDRQAIIEAMMELGDWLLVFRRREAALEMYREAYDELRAHREPEAADAQPIADEAPDALPARLFSPALPVAIPTFLAHPYSRAALDIPADLPLRYKGYVDVGFRLNRYGTASQVRILGGTSNVNDDMSTLIKRHVRQAQYRPQLVEGEPVEDAAFEVRYYFTW